MRVFLTKLLLFLITVFAMKNENRCSKYFVPVKVCNYANPTQVGFMYMQELCFLVTRDAFLCHVLSGVSHHDLETRLI